MNQRIATAIKTFVLLNIVLVIAVAIDIMVKTPYPSTLYDICYSELIVPIELIILTLSVGKGLIK